MIQRVRLQNWRSHSNSEFRFSSGVNALLGIMGSGKSSVMDALCFGLFGTFPALNQRKIKLDEVIRSRPQQQAFSSVEVEFKTREGKQYTVLREIELGKGTKRIELRSGNVLLESSNSQSVNSQIEKLLKIDYDIFSRAVYSEQNEIDQFLDIPKGQRMERIDRLLKIDRFETARKNAGKVINKFADELSSKELLSHDILVADELSSIVELERERRELEQKIRFLSAEQQKTDAQKLQIEQKLYVFEEKLRELQKLNLRKELVSERLAGSRERLSELGMGVQGLSPEAVSSKKSELEAQIKNLRAAQDKIAFLENRKAGISSTIEVLGSEEFVARSELEALFPGISVEDLIGKTELKLPVSETERALQGQASQLKAQYQSRAFVEDEVKRLEFRSVEFQKKTESCNVRRCNAKEIIENLKQQDTCPLCSGNIAGEKKHELLQKNMLIVQQIDQELINLNLFIVSAKDKREELLAVRGQWDSLDRQFEKLQQDNKLKTEKVQASIKRLSSLLKKKSEVRQSEAQVSNELKTLSGAYSEERLEQLKESLRKLGDAEKALSLTSLILSLEKELAGLSQKISSFSFDEGMLKALRNQYSGIISLNEQQKAQVKSAGELLDEKRKRLEDLARKRELAEKYKSDMVFLKTAQGSLEIFQNALRRTQESLRAEFIESVNQIMSDVWHHLYPYEDLSGVKLIIDSGDYVLSARTSQGWINVEGRVSGGERSLACLALRVAFSLALAPNLSWLVLDEPTHNLDVAAIDMLAETLRERLPSLIEQILLITHEERLESAVSGNLYKLERNKELDEATRIVS